MSPRIIGLSGFAGSGKDTAADYLVEEHGYRRIAFADKLKDTVSDLFGLNREMLEGKGPHSRASRELPFRRLGNSTPRQVLQEFGVACRQLWPDVWVNHCLYPTTDLHDRVVITDVRFENEMEAIRDQGGILVRIERDEVTPSPRVLSQMHESERHMANRTDWDYVVYNNEGLPALFAGLEWMMGSEE